MEFFEAGTLGIIHDELKGGKGWASMRIGRPVLLEGAFASTFVERRKIVP